MPLLGTSAGHRHGSGTHTGDVAGYPGTFVLAHNLFATVWLLPWELFKTTLHAKARHLGRGQRLSLVRPVFFGV